MSDQKRVAAAFFRTAAGSEPVRDWLKELAPVDRKAIGDDLRTLEFGWPLGMPLCRPLNGWPSLWELRSRLSEGRISRVIFAFVEGRLVLLHGFIKKSPKTPQHEIKLADKRLKDLMK